MSGIDAQSATLDDPADNAASGISPQTATTAAASTLASTGASIGWPLGIGTATLLFGGLLLMLSSTRRRVTR